MNRFLATSSAAAMFTAAAIAQCSAISTGATNIGSGDDTLFATAYALAAPFTMAGSAGTTTWTHFRACTNGWIALCDATGTLTNCPTSTSYGSVAAATATSLYGPVGSNPRLMPYWGDLDSAAANSISYSTSGSITTVTWNDVGDYPATTGKTFAIELDSAAGTIKFNYSGTTFTTNAGTKYVGFSQSNGTAVTAVNFFPGPTASAAGGQHESFAAGTIDLAGKTLTFTPAGAGWSGGACTGAPASNVSYGAGCYTIPGQSFYQSFADAGLASAGLTGNAMNLSISGNGYTATWLPGAAAGLYIAPSGAAVPFAASDDGDSSFGMPAVLVPGGTFSGSATVSHNGIVTFAGVGNNPGDYTPTGPELAAATGATAFYLGWHDWNDTEVGSGMIKTELVGGIFCITWDGTESYASPEVANPGTQQIQFNLATGSVNYLWTSISADISSIYGSAYVVGWKPTGATADGGSINLSTALPATYAQTVTPMVLSAAPAPISTGVSGTLMTYTMSNIPSFAPPLPTYFAVTILSVSQNVPGIPLAIIGMPGCNLHLNSLDVINTALPPISATNVQTTTFFVPPGAPYGFQFFAQAAAFVNPPFATPAGINTFGATLSNAIASTVSTF